MSTPRDHPGVVAPPPLIYLIPLVAGIYVERFAPAHLVGPAGPRRAVLEIAGIVLILVGFALMIAGAITFRRAGTNVVPIYPATTVVSWGPYRFTRNPMYLGMTVTYVGVTLSANAVWPLVLLPFALAIMSYAVIAREERYLAAKFGESYGAYKSTARRWL